MPIARLKAWRRLLLARTTVRWRLFRAMVQFESSGEVDPLRQVIATELATHRVQSADVITIPQFFLSMWSRDPAEISRFLSSEHGPIGWNGMRFPDAWLEAIAARLQRRQFRRDAGFCRRQDANGRQRPALIRPAACH